MNTTQLVGRLTKDVDLKHTQSGMAVGSFTLAVNRGFKNEAGERETDFIQCVIWRKSAENLANFTRKGSQIGIEGRIQTRNYENQQGTRVYVTEVVVNNFHLLEPKSSNQSQGQQQQQPQQNNNQQNYNQQPQQNYQQQNQPFMEDGRPIDISSDDLPF